MSRVKTPPKRHRHTRAQDMPRETKQQTDSTSRLADCPPKIAAATHRQAGAKTPAHQARRLSRLRSQHRSNTLYSRSRHASCRTVPSAAKACGGNSDHLPPFFSRRCACGEIPVRVAWGAQRMNEPDQRREICYLLQTYMIRQCPPFHSMRGRRGARGEGAIGVALMA